MAHSVIDSIRKADSLARRAGEAAKTNNDFVDNYRAIINEDAAPETTDVNLGDRTLSNRVTFRNAKVGEKTGLQKISLLKSNGDKEDVFLIVPERESVGYGNIRGWGSPDDQNMYLTSELWKNAFKNKNYSRPESWDWLMEGMATMESPFTIAGDVLAANTIRNNITKNERSNYTGADKTVGLGRSSQPEGQIFGMIASNGEMVTPQETKYFLSNLKKNGYKGVIEIEQPERVQEHTGPAYVPGDILLGLLGLQPNRGSVGYTFKQPGSNSEYQSFIKNLRNSRRTK